MRATDKPTPKPQVRPSELVTREEAAAMLAVSVQLIDKLRYNGQLPYISIGRCIRFRRSTIEAMLQEVTSCN
jgi:excisionase family DNA binding protein